jgi:hypothetical protein
MSALIDHLAYEEFLNPHESTARSLNDFVPRSYQLEVFDAINKFNHVFWVKHRRAGGDFTALNIAVREMFKSPILCHYVFPTYALAKKVIWNGMTKEGKRFLDYFPKDLLTRKPNSSLMTIHMRTQCGNESIFQLVGSNRYNELRGTNPKLVIQSETAYQYPGVYDEIYRPILQENGGKFLSLSTYFGRNHFYTLGEMARNDPDWVFLDHNIDYTGVVSKSDIDRMREQGVAEDHIQQEFYNNPNVGAIGTYYAKQINEMRLNGQIGDYPWNPNYPVYTAWDLGTANNRIVFFQIIGSGKFFIDEYDDSTGGFDEICRHVNDLPYLRQIDFLPPDAEGFESLAISRVSLLRQRGIKARVLKRKEIGGIEDRIECVRGQLPMIRIDENKCSNLLKALSNYRQHYDSLSKTYSRHPAKDIHTHFADAFGYACQAFRFLEQNNRYDPKQTTLRRGHVRF